MVTQMPTKSAGLGDAKVEQAKSQHLHAKHATQPKQGAHTVCYLITTCSSQRAPQPLSCTRSLPSSSWRDWSRCEQASVTAVVTGASQGALNNFCQVAFVLSGLSRFSYSTASCSSCHGVKALVSVLCFTLPTFTQSTCAVSTAGQTGVAESDGQTLKSWQGRESCEAHL